MRIESYPPPPTAKVRDLIFAERNWHDFASHGRAARSERFKYIRNDDSDKPLPNRARPKLPKKEARAVGDGAR